MLMTEKQKSELIQREYYGDEFWKKTKQELDEMLAYRKSIKCKPDVFQQAQLALDKPFIKYYKHVVFND